ncbi:penicillin acylase family protein [Bogoriella caseilytica]|uniref:Penicillin amidase n=1 Tax=Bogoriella caseilytica TaxID=56055 RepID=A0A3N2BDP1_9MICO|nr:penicillin acylase family protein [Bogoriella caseilytica]ROR73370.1 penicillin amidase [Bogoriella caseilytica]
MTSGIVRDGAAAANAPVTEGVMAEAAEAEVPVAEVVVAGLRGPAEITIDRWGVPHIDAGSAHDAFVAQGFSAARDRLFQMETWRRAGLGRLAEVFGAGYLERDRAARLFLFRGDLEQEWASYGAGSGGDAGGRSGEAAGVPARAAVESFTAGVNAWIALCEQRPELLPPEFAALGFRPEAWSPADVVRIRAHGRFGNAENELARLLTLRDGGPEAEDLRVLRQPDAPVRIAPEIQRIWHALDASVLDTYRLARAPVTLPHAGGDGAAGAEPAGEPAEAAHAAEPAHADHAQGEGSNNWVIAGHRTATGRPLLASDPHRVISAPALRHLTHLRCPDFDVVGATEPMMPGVSIGHNADVAFGLTILPIDVEDLCIYELSAQGGTPPPATTADGAGPAPGAQLRYRRDGQWLDFERVTESIPVAGASAAVSDLLFTHDGPVLHLDPENGFAVALRAAWLEPGMTPYLGALAFLGVRNAEEFRAAMPAWGSPGANHVYADVAGSFGRIGAGRVPARDGTDGTVPAAGGVTWTGAVGAHELIDEHRPERGWSTSSNQYSVPPDSPAGHTAPLITRDWALPFRHERVCERLAGHSGWTLQEARELQGDLLSLPAWQAVELLRQMPVTLDAADPGAAALSMLLAWDGVMSVESRAARVAERWLRRHLRPALIRARLAASLPAACLEDAVRRAAADVAFPDHRITLTLLAESIATEDGATLVLTTLRGAYQALEAELGAPSPAWAWGDFHRSVFRHPLGPAGSPPDAPWPGSAETVSMASYDAQGVTQVGASFAVVMDVGDWDAALAISAPGQSADLRSPHANDLVDLWRSGGSFPLLYSAGAIAAHAEHRLVLRPAR